jgi:hypothetical protein
MNGARARSAWSVPAGLLFAALAGLFAMHGLGTHGVEMPAPAMVHSSTVDTVGTHGDASYGEAMHGEASYAGRHIPGAGQGVAETQQASAPAEGSGAMSMIGLCLAVLTGALLLLGALLVRHHGRRVPASWHPALRARFTLRAREHAPPCLAQLCILRC